MPLDLFDTQVAQPVVQGTIGPSTQTGAATALAAAHQSEVESQLLSNIEKIKAQIKANLYASLYQGTVNSPNPYAEVLMPSMDSPSVNWFPMESAGMLKKSSLSSPTMTKKVPLSVSKREISTQVVQKEQNTLMLEVHKKPSQSKVVKVFAVKKNKSAWYTPGVMVVDSW